MNRHFRRCPNAIAFAREQRKTANEFAHTVWHWVRNRKIAKQKFRREVPIPPFTVDFCCLKLKLIIEVDGAPHLTTAGKAYDRRRDRWLSEQGYQVLRIPGFAVLKTPDKVHVAIRNAIKQRSEALSLFPPLPQSGERGERIGHFDLFH
jgi:very-short-patch-repair endonuclease